MDNQEKATAWWRRQVGFEPRTEVRAVRRQMHDGIMLGLAAEPGDPIVKPASGKIKKSAREMIPMIERHVEFHGKPFEIFVPVRYIYVGRSKTYGNQRAA